MVWEQYPMRWEARRKWNIFKKKKIQRKAISFGKKQINEQKYQMLCRETNHSKYSVQCNFIWFVKWKTTLLCSGHLHHFSMFIKAILSSLSLPHSHIQTNQLKKTFRHTNENSQICLRWHHFCGPKNASEFENVYSSIVWSVIGFRMRW